MIKDLVREGEAELGNVAGIDPATDRYRAGKIRGLKDILEVDIEFEEDADERS
jgi:hypothetical protein